MYNAVGTTTALAATGFALAQFTVAAWVLIVAGLAILTILPRIRKKDRKH